PKTFRYARSKIFNHNVTARNKLLSQRDGLRLFQIQCDAEHLVVEQGIAASTLESRPVILEWRVVNPESIRRRVRLHPDDFSTVFGKMLADQRSRREQGELDNANSRTSAPITFSSRSRAISASPK